jgi:N6-adenosine-specific RNA methylase IME4
MQNTAPWPGAVFACEPSANTPIAIGATRVTPMQIRQFHPLANLFPLMEGDEFAALVEDVCANGLLVPIVLHEGMILEGRNRFRACEAAGVACRFEQYTGDDPVGFVVSMNLRRRHLDESQRAMVAAKLATMKQGARTDLSPIGEMSQVKAAELLNVGKRSVERAAEVRESGAPELASAVERGEVSVTAAADVASMSLEAQRELLAQCNKRALLEAAKRVRGARAEVRRAERIARIAAISSGNSALPQDRKYPVILADPPWHFEAYDEETGSDRAAGSHYPTMPLAEICKLPIADLATPDAVLFLWTTAPHLRQAFEVIDAWHFEYVSNIVWLKDKIGTGYWLRNQHELLLIARRGDMPAPAPACRPPSVIEAPTRGHSRKPDESYVLIEHMFPTLPRIELFARSTRPGWAAWGNELQSSPSPPVAEHSAEIADDGLDIPASLRRSAR